MTSDVRNILTALDSIGELWQPHRLASVNDYDVKVARLEGEFVWHTHPDTDELFLVVSGELTIQLRDRDVVLGPNDVFVVPRGVEHCPKADARDADRADRAEGHGQHRRCAGRAHVAAARTRLRPRSRGAARQRDALRAAPSPTPACRRVPL